MDSHTSQHLRVLACFQVITHIPGHAEKCRKTLRLGQSVPVPTFGPGTSRTFNQPPIQWIRGAVRPGVKRPRREAVHLSSAEIRHGLGLHTAPSTYFHDVRRDNIHIPQICSSCMKGIIETTFEVACTFDHAQPETDEFYRVDTRIQRDKQQHVFTEHQYYLRTRVADLFDRVTLPPQPYAFCLVVYATPAFLNLWVETQIWVPKLLCVGHKTMTMMITITLQYLC